MSNFGEQGWQPQAGNTAVKSKKGPVQKVNAVLEWAELTRKNAMSDKYQVVLTQLSDNAVEVLASELGITNVQHREDRGNFITVKSSFPIHAYDEAENEMNEIVGNGTKAVVALGAYEWNYNGKKG